MIVWRTSQLAEDTQGVAFFYNMCKSVPVIFISTCLFCCSYDVKNRLFEVLRGVLSFGILFYIGKIRKLLNITF